MKRTRTFLIVTLLTILCGLAVSCDADPVPDSSFIGTWELYYETNGTSRTIILELNEDGSGMLRQYNGSLLQAELDLEYVIDSSKINFYLTYNEQSYNDVCTYKFDGINKLNLSGNEEPEWFPADKYYTRLN